MSSSFSFRPGLQECFFHKAVIDKKMPSVVARLARQTAVMYDEIERIFNGQAIAQHFDKSWAVRSGLQSACAGEKDEKIGLEIESGIIAWILNVLLFLFPGTCSAEGLGV